MCMDEMWFGFMPVDTAPPMPYSLPDMLHVSGELFASLALGSGWCASYRTFMKMPEA